MTKKSTIKTSKFLSCVLRRRPDEIGIVLDANGWTDLDELISDDGRRIRARQGHSVAVDLGL